MPHFPFLGTRPVEVVVDNVSGPPCHGLWHVCVSLRFLCWSLHSWRDDKKVGPSGENWVYLSHEGGTSRMGLVPLRRGGDWLSLTVSRKDAAEWPSADQEDGFCRNTAELAPCSWTSSLRTVRNRIPGCLATPSVNLCYNSLNRLRFSCLSCTIFSSWILVQACSQHDHSHLVLGCDLPEPDSPASLSRFWNCCLIIHFYLGFLLSHLPVCRASSARCSCCLLSHLSPVLQRLLWLGPLALSHFTGLSPVGGELHFSALWC